METFLPLHNKCWTGSGADRKWSLRPLGAHLTLVHSHRRNGVGAGRFGLIFVKRRILLDSNVWRYFIDAEAVPALLAATRRSGHIVVMSPAVLYEAAKTRNVLVRDRLLSAMTLPLWKRLMPEAYGEAAEIPSEVRRTLPEWLKREPDLAWFKRVRYDWTRAKGGNWDRVRAYPRALESLENDVTSRARAGLPPARRVAAVVS